MPATQSLGTPLRRQLVKLTVVPAINRAICRNTATRHTCFSLLVLGAGNWCKRLRSNHIRLYTHPAMPSHH